jgi:hypothetical protein
MSNTTETPNDQATELRTKIAVIVTGKLSPLGKIEAVDALLASTRTSIIKEIRDKLPEKVADNIGNSDGDIDWGKRIGQNNMLDHVLAILRDVGNKNI